MRAPLLHALFCAALFLTSVAGCFVILNWEFHHVRDLDEP